MDTPDILQVQGIRVYGYTGFFPEEQVLGQWFSVDLSLYLNLAQAGATDELPHTLDYSQAVQQVQQVVKTARVKTIERLATLIADRLLENPPLQRVTVALTKCQPPIPDFDGHITLTITRHKP